LSKKSKKDDRVNFLSSVFEKNNWKEQNMISK
jgi:hypothetical protein